MEPIRSSRRHYRNTDMYLGAFFSGGDEATSQENNREAQVLVALRARYRPLLHGGLILEPLSTITRHLSVPLHVFLHFQAHTISHMFSHINHSDASVVEYWNESMLLFSCRAARAAVQSGSSTLELTAEIDIYSMQQQLGKVETARFEGDGVREKQCVICLEDLDVEMEVKRMPCSHIFHRNCLTRWLEESRLCPLCRFLMPSTTTIEDNSPPLEQASGE